MKLPHAGLQRWCIESREVFGAASQMEEASAESMPGSSDDTYHVYCGSETGYLKGVNINKKTFANLNKGSDLDREYEITVMIWANEDESQIHCALKNQVRFFPGFGVRWEFRRNMFSAHCI